jgi:hypothetical protein
MCDRCLAMPLFMELDPVLPSEPAVCPTLGLSVNRHHPKIVISVKVIEIPKYIQK